MMSHSHNTYNSRLNQSLNFVSVISLLLLQAATIAAFVIGYGMNIMDIVDYLDTTPVERGSDILFIFRLIGVFFPPLGGILGYV